MSFDLSARAPFRLDLTVWALRRTPVNSVDRWDGHTYRRVLSAEGETVELAVEVERPASKPRAAEVRLLVSFTVAGSSMAPSLPWDDEVRTSQRRYAKVAGAAGEAIFSALGLGIDLTPFYRIAAADERLGYLISPFEGLKPPRFFTAFEALVNGIACQQLSLAAGIHLVNRLCRAHGPRLGEAFGFPAPEDLAELKPEDLVLLGFSRRKADTIVSLALSITSGELDLGKLCSLDDAAAESRLMLVKGIGRWTARYVLLRGFGRLDNFPIDDLGAQNEVKEWLRLPVRPNSLEMERLLAKFEPYRGLIYFYLLLHRLATAGSIGP